MVWSSRLKTTLKMEMIEAKTPEMVRKQIWVHMMAYNLLRTLMWQAHPVLADGKTPQLSLQGTRQSLCQSIPLLAFSFRRARKVLTWDLNSSKEHNPSPNIVRGHPQMVTCFAMQVLPKIGQN